MYMDMDMDMYMHRMGKPLFDCSTKSLSERWRTGAADGSCD